MRAFGWICAAGVVLGVPAHVADNLGVLLLRRPAMAVVLDGSSLAVPSSIGGFERVALRFTVHDGREVTAFVPVAPWPFGWPTAPAGTEVAIRYDPRDPATRVTFRSAGGAVLRLLADLLGGWLMLSWSVRVGRGAPGSAPRTFWPPWPFGR
jgi:hypothetical protein